MAIRGTRRASATSVRAALGLLEPVRSTMNGAAPAAPARRRGLAERIREFQRRRAR